MKLKLKLIYDRQSVGQCVLVSGAHLGPAINFSFSLKFPSDSCGFIILWRPLWREGGGAIIYCTIASGPCQSSHSWVEVPQNSRPYFTVSSETPQPTDSSTYQFPLPISHLVRIPTSTNCLHADTDYSSLNQLCHHSNARFTIAYRMTVRIWLLHSLHIFKLFVLSHTKWSTFTRHNSLYSNLLLHISLGH
jgi:hypothetical protein